MGCTAGRTEGRGMLPAGRQLLTLQLVTWGSLKSHGQTAEPRLSLVDAKNYQDDKNMEVKTEIQLQRKDVFIFYFVKSLWCHYAVESYRNLVLCSTTPL